jgi:hypothetical protein
MVRAVEKVRERLLRATAALGKGSVPYAVVGGNAVAVWVARVDESAVRNTQDVDILVRRSGFEKAKAALESVNFIYRHSRGVDLFLDGPKAKARDAVRLVFAGEKVRPHELLPNPEVSESVLADKFRVATLEALVQIKLTAFRDKDRTHLRDLLAVGLIDAEWCKRLPKELAERLQHLIDTPEG